MSSTRFSDYFTRHAFIWPPAFSQRKIKLHRSENLRLHVGPQVLAPSEDFQLTRLASTEQIVDRFSDHRYVGDSLWSKFQIKTFLESAEIDRLRTGGPPEAIVSTPKVLLDDRNDGSVCREQVTGTIRPPTQPISAYELYTELNRIRIPATPQDGIAAERRLIYITDLDPHCALALAATASASQAAFLRDFIYRHLAFRALIGTNIWDSAPGGDSIFALEFHLPYYAWRRMPEAILDNRQRTKGGPLRRSEEVIHLWPHTLEPMPVNDFHDFIYESQISVMITGLDHWVWAAYCFVDVYFKGEDHREHAQDYADEAFRADPHSCGRYPASPPIWNPREYFLRALSARIEQVKQEWNNSISSLMDDIEPYIHRVTREDGNEVSGDLDYMQRKGFRWTMRVLRQFANLLSKTITAWETFNQREIRYFYRSDRDELAEPYWGTYLVAIERDVTEMRTLHETVKQQTELFENMTNSLVLHAQHAETIIARDQSKFIQALTVLTIFYLPPTLASAIFSMQAILPAQVKLKYYLITLLVLFTVTTLIVIQLPSLTDLWQSFGKWRRQWRPRLVRKLSKKVVVEQGAEEDSADEYEGDDDSDDGIQLQDRASEEGVAVTLEV